MPNAYVKVVDKIETVVDMASKRPVDWETKTHTSRKLFDYTEAMTRGGTAPYYLIRDEDWKD